MMAPLEHYVLLSALVFALGLGTAAGRRNAVFVLLGLEMMLGAGTIALAAFWRAAPAGQGDGLLVLVVLGIALSAAEAAVGLALLLNAHRITGSADVDGMDGGDGE